MNSNIEQKIIKLIEEASKNGKADFLLQKKSTDSTDKDFPAFISIDSNTKSYDNLTYTTDSNTFKLIVNNLTFRSSNLTSSKLNDQMEKERADASQYAGSVFITCFSHISYESTLFWALYGGKVKELKVQLIFKNFIKNFTELFNLDYAITNNEKKCFVSSQKYGLYVNNPDDFSDYNDYDLNSYIHDIEIFDIDYIPNESHIFTDSHSKVVEIEFGSDNTIKPIKQKMTDVSILGKHKSVAWKQEEETRLLYRLSDPTFSDWDYIDFRVKPELFRDLTVILSPWDNGTLYNSVRLIIDKSRLPSDIKKSIIIKDSALKGSINI